MPRKIELFRIPSEECAGCVFEGAKSVGTMNCDRARESIGACRVRGISFIYSLHPETPIEIEVENEPLSESELIDKMEEFLLTLDNLCPINYQGITLREASAQQLKYFAKHLHIEIDFGGLL